MESKPYKSIEVKGGRYYAMNQHKWDDVVEKLKTGYGKDGQIYPKVVRPDDETIAVYYDRRGGLFLDKEFNKVESGLFWDFEERKPRGVKRSHEEVEAQKKAEAEAKEQAKKGQVEREKKDQDYQNKEEEVK